MFSIGSHASPVHLINYIQLSASLEELLSRMFQAAAKQRATAFDLLPAAFLRNDDPAIIESARPVSDPDNTGAEGSKPGSARFPRESAPANIVSRYKSDFLEAGRLGRGGFGEVVRSRNKFDGRFYAVKKIKSRSTSALNDVLSEAMILSQINHPYVVRYYNAWLEQEADIPPRTSMKVGHAFS